MTNWSDGREGPETVLPTDHDANADDILVPDQSRRDANSDHDPELDKATRCPGFWIILALDGMSSPAALNQPTPNPFSGASHLESNMFNISFANVVLVFSVLAVVTAAPFARPSYKDSHWQAGPTHRSVSRPST